ncbi:hypothetical protein J4E93_003181 [Alternaria ventricosa]|uniref:uncharacterized protein n=1 Tax=Alternaria ventricosa TaxID=1187951 RepID=UPI0020C20DFF|nr:uncharacterized protein J4E93_003181 [Alternaria ventricosa]KAI4650824.1 hypothetical protein J4E93_003181 [Alternaria ventricosa]
MSSPLLLPEDTVKRLQIRDASLVGGENNGTRKISLGLLSPPSSTTSRNASNSSSSSEEVVYISIPTRLDSAQTLEFMGLTPDKSKELYASRQHRQQITHTNIDLQRWVIEHVVYICADILDEDDDWKEKMTDAGIKQEISDALMKDEHRVIRGVQSLSEWLEEILETNYLALVDMNARILQELAAPPSVHLKGGAGEPYTVPNAPEGHIALFKSVEFRRCAGCIAEDGSLNLARLESTGPTDFARRGGLYFTHEIWVSNHYSSLITDACPVADRRTVELHVPLSHLTKMKVWDLKFEDDNFKQLLFFSRREEKYPKPISQLRAAHGIIAGPIGHAHNLAFGKMKSWKDITEKHQLQERETVVDGKGNEKEIVKYGRQWVWIGENSVEQLEEDCRDKVYLRRPEQGLKLVPQPWKDESAKGKGIMK